CRHGNATAARLAYIRPFRPLGRTVPHPSSRPGLGAIAYSGGVTFRVWAPFAPSVFVAGEFNAWSATAAPLAAEGNGHWSVDLPGATVGQQYTFIVGVQWRIELLAQEVTSSSGNA